VLELNLPPRIVEYRNYHEFLADYYRHKKLANKTFSFRRFAQLAGIKSSNYLMLVMQERRKLSAQAARAVAKAMKLSRAESSYFISLVGLERSADADEHEKFDKERKVAIRKIVTRMLPIEKRQYLATWYYPLLRELPFLSDFQASAEWISHKLQGLITPKQAEQAMKTLVDLGLWKLHAGKIVVSDLILDTGDDITSFSESVVVAVHKETLLAWTRIFEKITKEEREFGLINIPIHHEKIPELKRRIRQFQDELIGWLQEEKNPTQLVQVGTYLVPMTRGIATIPQEAEKTIVSK